MATARDIVEGALRKIHVLGNGASLPAEESSQALENLNDLLAYLSAEEVYIYQETKETFNLVGSTASYTIASGGDFDTTAPEEITAAFVTQGDTDYGLEQYDEVEYANIYNKNIEGLTNGIFYYDNNYPTARIYLWPVPTGADTITLYSRKALTEFSGLTTTFAFPNIYKPMLIYNLAVWMAPEYEREPSRQVIKVAKQTLNAVQARNERNNKPISSLGGIPLTGSRVKSYGKAILGGLFS